MKNIYHLEFSYVSSADSQKYFDDICKKHCLSSNSYDLDFSPDNAVLNAPIENEKLKFVSFEDLPQEPLCALVEDLMSKLKVRQMTINTTGSYDSQE